MKPHAPGPQTSLEKAIDRQIEATYYRLARNQMIDMLDIPKVFTESRRAIAAGSTVDQAVRAAVLMYCEAGGERP